MMGRWGGPYIMSGAFGIGGFVAMILQMIVWIVVIVAAVRFFKGYFPHKNCQGDVEDQALEILRQRYAKGEIDTEEYNLRKRELESK